VQDGGLTTTYGVEIPKYTVQEEHQVKENGLTNQIFTATSAVKPYFMKHLYNTIKPVGNRAIVAVIDGEKNKHKITGEDGNEVEIFVDTSFSWDGKIAKHTQGILLTDFKNLKAGTHVLLYHNGVGDENRLDIYIDPSTSIHAVEGYSVYFGYDGGELICVDGYMIAERIYEDLNEGGMIIAEKKKKECFLKILAKPDSVTDFEVGDVALVHKYSDYELTHNLGGKRTSIIRLKYSDCLGKL
jgi:hypothetical protein